ncbi:MAG: transcription-repair coupling factor [Clostridiales bacterium]|nr:transcription-repair coupling factor [Clostridiales bacterium]
MSALVKTMAKSREFSEIEKSFRKGFLPQGIIGLSSVQKAHIVSALTQSLGRKALIIVPDEQSAVRMCEDIASFGLSVMHFPARSLSFYANDGQSYEYEQRRIRVLRRMIDGNYDIVVASVEAAICFTVPKDVLSSHSIRIKKGDEISVENLLLAFDNAGYSYCEAVEGVGQYSHRGGIIDFFSPDSDSPIRLEMWGDTVDTICHFDPESQRRTDNTDDFIIAPSKEFVIKKEDFIEKLEALAKKARGKKAPQIRESIYDDIDRLNNGLKVSSEDKYLPLIYSPASIFDYIGDDMLFVSESGAVKDRVTNINKLLLEEIKNCVDETILFKGLDKFALSKDEFLSLYEKFPVAFMDEFARGSFDIGIKNLTTFSGNSLPVWNGKVEVLADDVYPLLKKKARVLLFAGTDKNAKNVTDLLREYDVSAVYCPGLPENLSEGIIAVIPGSLSSGFSYASNNLYVFTYSKVHAGAKKRRNKNYKAHDSIHSLDELNPGDYVVHVSYGIGIFDSFTQLTSKDGGKKIVKDYIKIRFAGSDVLYVPVTQLDLISKYIGPHDDSGKGVKLNRLSGNDWEKQKAKVKSAVKDMADELIKLYSQRLNEPGYAFSPDFDMQSDFERRFEFEETIDQLRCIEEIKRDMEMSHPMDRLLCGDVGFGKTEVALRAVFKCIADGKQCAVLVPTTILALQHYQTMLRRFDGFPVTIEMLSRFRTAKEQAKIIRGLNSGFVDVVVGTHRMISKDIKFKDLGLLIVDEEQRFGVAQKEKLKEKFPGVDVLTLSATPIPRTLNMAMSGIRDMSVIEEAPADRFPVQTYVVEHDIGLLCEAMEKELRRGGQVYYLHNRTESINQVAGQIKELLPDARVAVAHGKMNEETLSDIWRKLMEGEIDILVCTTIIETGVDVPNVNTLIIEDADNLGLSQLHQIRGRVGRSPRRASAYLTFKRNKNISETAYKRLQAIREYTEFGSGFKIAMRDLEIRGAGNLLGAQQHGHLASVGYDMYMQLLSEAVSDEKGIEKKKVRECLIDIQIPVHIPEEYIPALSQRLVTYRRIADIQTLEDASDVRDELRDRYGNIPYAVEGLINVSLCRNIASALNIREIGQKDDVIILYCDEINPNLVLELSGALIKRVTMTTKGRQSINVKMNAGQSPLDTMVEIFETAKVCIGSTDNEAEKNENP